MAEKLILLLLEEPCSVRKIKSFLKKRRNKRSIINQEVSKDYLIPLHVALRKRRSTDILKILIDSGADVNLKWRALRFPLTSSWDFNDEGLEKETLCYNTVKLLLKSGANVNGQDCWDSPLIEFVRNRCVGGSKVYLPILQMILKHANKSTKTIAFYTLARYPSVCLEECYKENIIAAIKIFLESHISLSFEIISNWLHQMMLCCLNGNESYINTVLKIILPYFMRDSSEDIVDKMDFEFRFIVEKGKIASRRKNVFLVGVLRDLLINTWENCVKEYRQMNYDILMNNLSVLKVLQVFNETEFENNSESVEALYGVLRRLAHNKYHHFRDIMSNIIKSSDMMELYVIIYTNCSDNVLMLNPDCVYIVIQHLTKEDVLNFLLAFLLKEN